MSFRLFEVDFKFKLVSEKRKVIPERLLTARKLTGLSADKFIRFIGTDMGRQKLVQI